MKDEIKKRKLLQVVCRPPRVQEVLLHMEHTDNVALSAVRPYARAPQHVGGGIFMCVRAKSFVFVVFDNALTGRDKPVIDTS